MSDKMRVGILGTGYVAINNYLPILSGMDDVEVAAILSGHIENAQKAAKRFGAVKAVSTIEELVDEGIDCAFVLTPKGLHFEHVSFLLDKGIPTYCEKPLATDLRDARELARMSEATNTMLMVGFNRRFAPVVQAAKEVWGDTSPDVIITQKNRPETEYHATLENAVHMVDILRFFGGEAREVHALAKYSDPDYETFTTAMIEFECGSSGMLIANRSAGQWEETIEMHGGNKTVIVNMPESLTVIDKDKKTTVEMTPLNMGWAKSEERMGFSNATAYFIDCVRNGTMPKPDAADAVLTHELLDKILEDAGLPR